MRPVDIAAFVAQLAALPSTPQVTNPYEAGAAGADARRHNLRRYLAEMGARQQGTLLLFEAPGYRGCRITGVPVTSRHILLGGLPELDLFGQERGYVDSDESAFAHIQREQSATILWSALGARCTVPLVWNAFVCHPHRPGQPLSNRRPTLAEVRAQRPQLERLLELARPATIVAVGAVAHGALAEMGIAAPRIRHPAQGGKAAFLEGLDRYLGPGAR
jgi:uracil-DNA glycosylase